MRDNIRSKVAVIIPCYKAKNKLGWEPNTTLEELVSEMIAHDKEIFIKESFLKEHGFDINNYLSQD